MQHPALKNGTVPPVSGASGQRNRAGPRTTEGIGSCVGKQLTVEWISHVLRLFFSEQPQQHVPILVPRRIKCALGHQLFVKCDVFVMNETLHMDLHGHKRKDRLPCILIECSAPWVCNIAHPRSTSLMIVNSVLHWVRLISRAVLPLRCPEPSCRRILDSDAVANRHCPYC